MFYFLTPILGYHWILISAAVIPALFLMIKVYKSDRLEKESFVLLKSMVIGGVLSSLVALVIEWVGNAALNVFVPADDPKYNVILYFVVVGLTEEGCKYLFLKKRSWGSAEFNCRYDGIVYAVFTSLGFAVWENISYVLHYGFSTALVRAVTAIPGHACFGVFMGTFYGLSRGYAFMKDDGKSKFFRMLSVIIPTLIHGTYDYIASTETSEWNFVIFIAIMFVVSLILVSHMSRNDKYINADRNSSDFWSN